MKKILTDRLTMIPISMNHCSDRYVSWLNDPNVYQYLEARGGYTIEKLHTYIKSILENRVVMWGIHIKDSNKHIGNIKMDPINRKHGVGEYGILMGDRTEWGKGYAKEASIAILRHCFSELNLRKITLGVIKENTVAFFLYKKLGFDEEGLYKEHVNYDGKYHDIIRMAIFNPNVNYLYDTQ